MPRTTSPGALDPADEPIGHRFDGGPDGVLKLTAIREVFEESGVWLFVGGGRPSCRKDSKAWRDNVHDSAEATAAMMEQYGCRPAFSKLHKWCTFQTPDAEAAKLKKGGFDTSFYLAACSDDDLDHLDADQSETTMMCWLSPHEVRPPPWRSTQAQAKTTGPITSFLSSLTAITSRWTRAGADSGWRL